MTTPIHPYQQEIIDKIAKMSECVVLDVPPRSSFGTFAPYLKPPGANNMTSTQALEIARNRVSIYKNGIDSHSWVISKPWRSTDPRGPSTTVQVGYYATAQRARALAVADIAMELVLEGEDKSVRESAYHAMAYESESRRVTGARALLAVALADARLAIGQE